MLLILVKITRFYFLKLINNYKIWKTRFFCFMKTKVTKIIKSRLTYYQRKLNLISQLVNL